MNNNIVLNERELLIRKLKQLIENNEIKQQKYRQQYNLSCEYGCLTREVFMMAKMLPSMHQLGVTFNDCQ